MIAYIFLESHHNTAQLDNRATTKGKLKAKRVMKQELLSYEKARGLLANLERHREEGGGHVKDLHELCAKNVPFPALQERGLKLVEFIGRGSDAEFVSAMDSLAYAEKHETVLRLYQQMKRYHYHPAFPFIPFSLHISLK